MSRGRSLAYKPGAGAERDYWAIKKWLEQESLTIAEVAESLGINAGIVSATIRGTRNTRRVLVYLLSKGCPVNALSLPDDMNTGQGAVNVSH